MTSGEPRLVAVERGIDAYVDALPKPRGRLPEPMMAQSVELGLVTDQTDKAAFFDDVISPSRIADYCAL